MEPTDIPSIAAVDVIPAQAKEDDVRRIHHIASTESVELDEVAFVVRIELDLLPPVTSRGYALYLGNYRIRKYWAYSGGIYFKVYNPRFFEKYGGKRMRFSLDGKDFYDTGFKLPTQQQQRAATAADAMAAAALPTQEEVLSGPRVQ